MAILLQPDSEADILIVDDTPDNLRLLAKILEAQNYTVRKSLNGRMALQAASRNPPDLILLDINMPEMNGYEVCQKLRESDLTANIPIIFISALDQVSDKVRAFEIGGQDYIAKPFQEMEVLMRVRNQLLIRQQQKRLIQQNLRLKQEISERLKIEAEVRQLSLTDELTGLYNRRGFFLLAEQQLKIAQRAQLGCCFGFADLDGLKIINDTLGHDEGDRCIVDAARILTQTFRDSDILARLGGDEFVVLIPACTEGVDDFHKRLQDNIDHFNQTSDRLYTVSISLGIQICTLIPSASNVSVESFLAQADRLMYQNKRSKRAPESPDNQSNPDSD